VIRWIRQLFRPRGLLSKGADLERKTDVGRANLRIFGELSVLAGVLAIVPSITNSLVDFCFSLCQRRWPDLKPPTPLAVLTSWQILLAFLATAGVGVFSLRLLLRYHDRP